MFLTLIPSGGRDYKSGKEVQAAWNEGHDFRIADIFHSKDGKLVNKDDAPKGYTLNIRYKRLTQIKQIKV